MAHTTLEEFGKSDNVEIFVSYEVNPKELTPEKRELLYKALVHVDRTIDLLNEIIDG